MVVCLIPLDYFTSKPRCVAGRYVYSAMVSGVGYTTRSLIIISMFGGFYQRRRHIFYSDESTSIERRGESSINEARQLFISSREIKEDVIILLMESSDAVELPSSISIIKFPLYFLVVPDETANGKQTQNT